MSIVSEQFSPEWKTGRVIQVLKKCRRFTLDNYKRISIMPVAGKLIENILYVQMLNHLVKERPNLLRPFHSTTTTLLDCTNEWYVNMDHGHYNLAVDLDLKKAFDTVNQDILLRKLQMYGFGLLYWTYRTQSCQLQKIISDQRQIICGILQERILGPLLFIIYINYLPNSRLFANYTSLTAVGETLDKVEERANEDLMNVRKWHCVNKLSLNIAKSKHALIGSRYKINKTDVQPRVKIGSHSIKRVKHTKVLGVQIDESLNGKKY